MLVIGLTGGIGSGKSTVAKLFAEKGISVIDADLVAREVSDVGTPAFQQIIDKFGQELTQSDGQLDRAKLRKKIFENEQERKWLEDLLHPIIRKKIKQNVNNATSDYVVLVIPLLLETEPNPIIDRVLVVDAPEPIQIKRTQNRDNLTENEIKKIISTQIKRTERLAAADDLIINDGSLSDLNKQVERLHHFYTVLAQKTLIK